MAKRTTGMDKFVQYFGLTTVESAANTLTFQQLQTGGMIFERRGMIIHRLEYVLSLASWDLLVDTSDRLEFGVTLSNILTTVPIHDSNVVDLNQVDRNAQGTPASAWADISPIVRDFSTLPGGGIVVPAFPLYGFVRGTSLAGAATVAMRGYYTVMEMDPVDFVELVQALRIIT